MNSHPFLVAALMCHTLGIAQESPQAPNQSELAWRTFQAANGTHWTAAWNQATSTPEAIYGPGLRLAGAVEDLNHARVEADGLLKRYATLLGRGGSNFVEHTGIKINRVYVFVYDQYFKGLPVKTGRADVRIHDTGVVAMFGASAVEIPVGFGLRPTLNAAVAKAIAEGHVLGEVSKKPGVPPPALVIWANTLQKAPTRATLAWEVQIDERPAKTAIGKAYIDAATGAVLEFVNEVYTCSSCGKTHAASSSTGRRHTQRLRRSAHLATTARAGMAALTGRVLGWTNTGLTPTAPLSNVPLANLLVTSTSGNAFTDAKGNFSIPHNGNSPVTVFATLEGRHSRRISTATGTRMTASTVVNPGTPGTIQFGTANIGQLDRSQTTTYWHVDDVNTWVRSLLPTATAAMNRISGMSPRVNINQACNAFYGRNTINFYNAGGACNMTAFSTIIYHEWGHGLDDTFGGITQTDGLSEGWGDIIATYRSGQPIIGAGFRTNGGAIRTALNTRTYPVNTNSVHTKGEPWMGFAWDLRTNLISKLGATLGAARANQIVVASIAANARNQPAAVREVFILDDNDGNLNNGTPNYDALEKAATKRSIPFPKLQLGSVTHTPLKSTREQLVQRIVHAKAVPFSGTFTKVELVYNTGTAAVRREMVPSGNQNEFIALLPGLLSPTSVAYHIEATHSTTRVLRFPDNGEVAYSIGADTEIFFDDFEGIDKGWTHAQVATQDDWQWGVPNGKGGTSQNVSWVDPAKAASGTRCRGNDLGPSGWNGAYQPRVENYLRSPAFNTLGKTGVTLRFKRWLTVEESQFDQATIRVGNQTVWTNPFSGHVLDRAWTDFELKIPQADNQASVQLEWRLKSDAGLHLGGWHIDDVRVFTTSSLPPPKMQLGLSPAQVGLGKSSSVSVKGTANAPMVLLVSLKRGPTPLPGLPTLFVGGPFTVIGAGLDASGQLKFNFVVPTVPASTGQLTYIQALEQSSASTITASNGAIVLFGK